MQAEFDQSVVMRINLDISGEKFNLNLKTNAMLIGFP